MLRIMSKFKKYQQEDIAMMAGKKMASVFFVSLLIVKIAFAEQEHINTDQTERTAPEIMEKRQKLLDQKKIEKITDTSPAVLGEVPVRLLDRVREKLRQLGYQDVILRQAEEVIWPTGAMGCDRPGFEYEQRPIRGYRVIYEAEGKLWDYRLSESGMIILCETLNPVIK